MGLLFAGDTCVAAAINPCAGVAGTTEEQTYLRHVCRMSARNDAGNCLPLAGAGGCSAADVALIAAGNTCATTVGQTYTGACATHTTEDDCAPTGCEMRTDQGHEGACTFTDDQGACTCACTFTGFEDSLSESCRTCQVAHLLRAAIPAECSAASFSATACDAAEAAIEAAANAVCAPAVNCAETGNTAADCLATCAVAAATVVTAATAALPSSRPWPRSSRSPRCSKARAARERWTQQAR